MDRMLILRRTIQVSIVAFLPLLPLLGWVHVDVENANLTLFGLHIWAHEATLVVIPVAFAFALLAALAAIGGRLFCGWVCPQTALSELAAFVEALVRRSLRRPWPVKLAGIGLGIVVTIAVCVVGGLAIVTFFVPASAFATLTGPHLNTSLLKGLSIATMLVFVVVVVFRHMYCEWMCLFGWWQRLFAGPRSLHITFDVNRSRACTNCGHCRSVCFMKLEPRQRKLPPTCLNCAKCVGACERELAGTESGGLIALRFATSDKRRIPASHSILHSIDRRLALAALLVVATASGLWLASSSRQPVQVVMKQEERLRIDGNDTLNGVYGVEVFNNQSRPVVITLEQKGLDISKAQFSPSRLTIGPRERGRSELTISADHKELTPGRHALIVAARAEAESGRVMVSEGKVIFIVPPSRQEDQPGSIPVAPANIGRAN